jgi:hypothetical protein
MRLWSLHPEYLDARGLVALWREGLLARKILAGHTKGYRNHPQLHRFKAAPDSVMAIDSYLRVVLEESKRRGYRFDESKIGNRPTHAEIPVTRGQLLFEMAHLQAKLEKRDKAAYLRLQAVDAPRAHPIFYVADGPTEDWERNKDKKKPPPK